MKVLKTVKVNDESIKVNFVIRCTKRYDGYLKVVHVSDSFLLCVPFKEVKDRIFAGIRERTKFYNSIGVKLHKIKNKNWDVEIYGKHLSNLEKKVEEKEQRKEKRELKVETEQESKKEAEEISFIENRFKELEKEIVSKMNDKIDSVVDVLRNEGKYYGFKYHDFSVDDVAKKGIKKLGEEGYRYVFELNGKLVFIREGGKK
jgi:DNA mismatch repair ATPase MutS